MSHRTVSLLELEPMEDKLKQPDENIINIDFMLIPIKNNIYK